jgi:Protein of unknown function (DUF2470)
MASEKTRAFETIVDYMNTQRPESAILFAWRLLGKKDAVDAEIVDMDESGMRISMKRKSSPFSKAVTSVEKYSFRPPLKVPGDARGRLMSLHRMSSFASWPPGPGGFIALGLWALFLFSIISPARYPSLQAYIEPIHNAALSVVKSPKYGQYGLVAMTSVHSLEAVYIIYLLRSCPGSFYGAALGSWQLVSLILGFSVLERAQIIASVRARRVNKSKGQ